MSRRWSRTALATFVWSLAFAASECAWVLYTQQSGVPGWLLVAASPTVAGCTKQLDIREGEARQAHEARLRLDGRTVWYINRETQTELSIYGPPDAGGGRVYQCFPDTIDPRGPKAK